MCELRLLIRYTITKMRQFSSTTVEEDNSEHLMNIIHSLSNLPSRLLDIIVEVIIFLIYLTMFFGILLLIWGIIEWSTGWNEHGGKRNVIRGIILLAISSVLIGL